MYFCYLEPRGKKTNTTSDKDKPKEDESKNEDTSTEVKSEDIATPEGEDVATAEGKGVATAEGEGVAPAEGEEVATAEGEDVKSDESTTIESKPEPIEEDEAIPETPVDAVDVNEAAPVSEEIISSDETVKTSEEETKEVVDENTTPTDEVSAEDTTAEAPVVPRVIYDLLPDYVLIGKVDTEQLVAGPTRPATRQECEVVMMIGLPGSGKTTWALNYAKEHEDKNFYLLSQATILERATVNIFKF